jgi:hypothetical protein
MSFHLAKCIDITPNGVLRPGFPQDYREYRREPWFPQVLATSSHIRFWVDWPSLQPTGGLAFGEVVDADHGKRLLGLDEQIRLANQDGLKTILMPYRYPRWVNGTEHINQAFGWDNFFYKPGDRAALTTWRNWHTDPNNWPKTLALATSIRALEYELPLEDNPGPESKYGHGPGSKWAGYVEALFDRYVAHGDSYGRADYFEVVNEPNLQLWPQRSPTTLTGDVYAQFAVDGSRLTAHKAVAEMMLTMDQISRRYSPRVDLIAPSTSDTDVRTAARRSTIAVPWRLVEMPDGLEHFVPSLLDELDGIGFEAGPNWIWSYHNYNDAELTGDRVTALRETIRHRWKGRTLDGGPMLFSTEGGIRLVRAAAKERLTVSNPAHAARIRELQALMLDEAFHLHRRSTGVGAGVALFTQYTLRADPNFDCGLREAGGDERKAFGVWCGLMEFDPHDPLPSEWRPRAAVAAATG